MTVVLTILSVQRMGDVHRDNSIVSKTGCIEVVRDERRREVCPCYKQVQLPSRAAVNGREVVSACVNEHAAM